jgi:hypothetical protein
MTYRATRLIYNIFQAQPEPVASAARRTPVSMDMPREAMPVRTVEVA